MLRDQLVDTPTWCACAGEVPPRARRGSALPAQPAISRPEHVIFDTGVAQRSPRYGLPGCGEPAGDEVRLVRLHPGIPRLRCCGPHDCAGFRLHRSCGDGRRTGPVVRVLVLVLSALVPGGLVRGPRRGRSRCVAVRGIRRGVGAQHVGQRGPHGQDQDRQAGHDHGDGPWCPCRSGLGQQVVGDLPGHAERERADRGPLGKPPGPVADPGLAGQPGAQGVGGVGLDADREGDGGVQVEGGPDARQRRNQPEPRLLRDADPAGPDLGRGRGGQDQQRPGSQGPAWPGGGRGPVRGGSSGGPRRDRTTPVRAGGGGGAGSDRSHAGYHPSAVASGWGSPVSAARAAATSEMLART